MSDKIFYPTNARDTRVESKEMTISEAFEAYRTAVIVFRNQSIKTEENHRVAEKSLIRHLGDIPVSEIAFEDVRSWKASLDTCRSPETVRNYIIKLRVVLSHLQRIGVPALDPELIPVPKRSTKPPVCITHEQVSELIEATPNIRCKAIISLLYSSGIRVSELCSLNRNQLQKGKFTITGKGGKSRLCFYDTRTEALVRQYLATRKDESPALFYTPHGRISPGTVQELFKRLRKKTGIESVHPHTLRHTFATELMQSGMHIYTLSRLLGHSNIQTTQVYLHLADPQLQDEYQKYFRF